MSMEMSDHERELLEIVTGNEGSEASDEVLLWMSVDVERLEELPEERDAIEDLPAVKQLTERTGDHEQVESIGMDQADAQRQCIDI